MAPQLIENNVIVINVIKKYPILFNVSHPDYKNVIKRNKAWDEAGRQLNTTGENLKKKWKNLRDCYFKYLKCFTTTPGPRLKAYERYKKWQWASQMDYFKNYMGFDYEIEIVEERENKNNNVGTMTTKEITSCKVTSEPYQPTVELPNISRAIKRPRRTFTNNQIVEDVSYSLPNSTELSSLQHLMLSYAKTLETFSERRKSITKMKIAQIIMEAELEEFEELKQLEEQRYVSDSNEIEPYDEVVIKEEAHFLSTDNVNE